MKFEKVALSSIFPDPNNANKHSDKSITAIAASLSKFGQQKPIVVGEDNVIYAGNGTYEAAKKIGWKHIHIHRTTLDGFNAMAYALADNQTAKQSELDMDMVDQQISLLVEQMPEVKFEDFGFSCEDINPNIIDPDDAFGKLGEGDKTDDIEQITFTLTSEQSDLIKDALKLAGGRLDEDATGNPNKNGNAIYYIVSTWMDDNG